MITNVMAQIKTLAKWYRNSANSKWSSLWEGNVTLMDKMMSSVSQLLPRSWQGSIVEAFLGAVGTSLNALWEMNNVKAQLQMLEDEDEDYGQRKRERARAQEDKESPLMEESVLKPIF